MRDCLQGAKDRSFVQIYSRTPNPGDEFIELQKAKLAELGYDVEYNSNATSMPAKTYPCFLFLRTCASKSL
jgi:lipocalin